MGPDVAWKHSATQLYLNTAIRNRQTEIQHIPFSRPVLSSNPSK